MLLGILWRDHLTLETFGDPAVPDGFEEGQKTLVVHLLRRFQRIAVGRHDIGEPLFLHRLQDPFGAERTFERLDQQSAVQFGLGISQLVIFGINDSHNKTLMILIKSG